MTRLYLNSDHRTRVELERLRAWKAAAVARLFTEAQESAR